MTESITFEIKILLAGAEFSEYLRVTMEVVPGNQTVTLKVDGDERSILLDAYSIINLGNILKEIFP